MWLHTWDRYAVPGKASSEDTHRHLPYEPPSRHPCLPSPSDLPHPPTSRNPPSHRLHPHHRGACHSRLNPWLSCNHPENPAAPHQPQITAAPNSASSPRSTCTRFYSKSSAISPIPGSGAAPVPRRRMEGTDALPVGFAWAATMALVSSSGWRGAEFRGLSNKYVGGRVEGRYRSCFLFACTSAMARFFVALFWAVWAAGVAAAPAPAATTTRPPPGTPTIGAVVVDAPDVDTEGSGCRAGSVGVAFATDNSAMTLIFDKFQAAVGPNAGDVKKRAFCRVNVTMSSPGWAFDVSSVDFRSYVNIAKGVDVSLVRYVFHGI